MAKKATKKSADKGKAPAAKAKPEFKTLGTREEAAAMLAQLGELHRQASALAERHDKLIAKLQERAANRLGPLYREMYPLFLSLESYATANRDAMTDQGKTKTIELETGKLFWRDTPERIEIDDPTAVLKALRAMKLKDFIRQPPAEVDKRAMQKDKDKARTVPGVQIKTDEVFYAQPSADLAELNEEIVAKLLKKAG